VEAEDHVRAVADRAPWQTAALILVLGFGGMRPHQVRRPPELDDDNVADLVALRAVLRREGCGQITIAKKLGIGVERVNHWVHEEFEKDIGTAAALSIVWMSAAENRRLPFSCSAACRFRLIVFIDGFSNALPYLRGLSIRSISKAYLKIPLTTVIALQRG